MDDPHFPSTPREMSANEKEQHWGENGINMRKRAEWRKDMNMIRSSNVYGIMSPSNEHLSKEKRK